MKDVIGHLINPKVPYNPNVRKFALVLGIKSKSAYKWVRKNFSKRLPDVRTLRRWNANINENFSTLSGFNHQAKLMLKKLAQERKAIGKETYLSACYDEVSIRQHLQWIHSLKRFSGLVNYGRRESDEVPIANFAIFFLVTLIESGQSYIFAYFLVKHLNTVEKSEVIKNVIGEINSTGCYLMSIAFDGLATNFSACEMLGASFCIENFRPYILNPTNSHRISIILDPPHCLKLVRNCLAQKANIKDGKDSPICWSFFEDLVFKKSELVSHKMTKKHIDFHSNKMNVKLAAQTLSLSVARSMELLLRAGDKSFSNAAGTIIFTKNINKAFDKFNSKHCDSSNLFKKGLNMKYATQIFEFLDYLTDYIKSLTLGGINILRSERRTGFLGFLINIETLRHFYNEFIINTKINRILFYYFGQDLLESLFGRMRSMLGANTNPTEEQLCGIIRQLVNFDEIKASEDANCQDELNILTIPSTTDKKSASAFETESTYRSSDNDNESETINNVHLTFKQLHTIKLRAGTIERKITYAIPRCTHEQCVNIFKTGDDKIDSIFFESLNSQRPTKSTVKICEIIYKIFMIHLDIFNFNYAQLRQKILNEIPFENLYTHIDFTHDMNHKSQFILLIIDEYIRIHFTYIARLITLQIHQKIIGKSAQKLKHVLGQ